MTPRPPRRRPAVGAILRTVGAALALLTAGVASGPGTPAVAAPSQAAAPNQAPSQAPSQVTRQTERVSGTLPVTLGAPFGDAATLAEVLGLPDLTPLLDPVPDAEVLERELDEVFELSTGRMSAAVVDALTGEVLYDRKASAAAVPASAVKILTGLAALEVLGPDRRYTTSAVLLPGRADRKPVTHVVLDAGGDVLLGTGDNAQATDGRAGLGTLARKTAEQLAERGTTGRATVRLDDTGYTGPETSRDWSADIVPSGNAAAVQPIATHGGRSFPGPGTGRLHDPALFAAEVFRDRLEAEARQLGAEVAVDQEVKRVALKGRGTTVASVRSATVAQQVTHMLKTSDNQVAEATGRNLALAAGQEGSFDGAAAAIERAVAGLGVDATGLDLVDASGLSGRNRVSALQLTEALQRAATDPDLEAAAAGLPVAGREGTLEHRMVGSPAEGVVRAKTGTLSSVASLTGTVRTADGRPLAFSFIANGQTGALAEARFAVDRAAGLLAGCGCRPEPADAGG